MKKSPLPRPKFRATDVFTPGIPARATFVERENLNDQLVDALNTPGKQIVVYGQSGTGKSTLLTNKVQQVYGAKKIVSRCTIATTFENLLLSAFDQLEVFYTASASIKTTSSITGKLEQNYLALKTAIEANLSNENTASKTRLLPPQLTPERLAQYCGAADCCWVLEDFHKVPLAEKTRLSQIMKVFTDVAADYPLVKIIAIGAVDTARQVIQYDPEMRTRVAEIAVPMMTRDELMIILKKGEELLNIQFGSHKEQIAEYSSGLGAICHQIGLNMCNSAGITETCEDEYLIKNEQFKDAIQRYLIDSSDTLKQAFDIAMRRTRSRKFDNTRLILEALTLIGANGATKGEILKKIHVKVPDYPSGNLTTYLPELQSSKRGSILRFDTASGKFYFSDPLYHAYAQCLFVPPKQASFFSITLLGVSFNMENFGRVVNAGTVIKAGNRVVESSGSIDADTTKS
jgi:GTPase SAR1 family protein